MSSSVTKRLVIEVRYNRAKKRWEAVREGDDDFLLYYAELKAAVVRRIREVLRGRWETEGLPGEMKVRMKNGQYSKQEATYGNDPVESPG